MVLFQQITSVPSPPWWAVAIVTALFLLSGLVNVIQLWKSRELAQWKGAAEAAESTNQLYISELKIVRDRADRLSEENESKSKRIGVLESRTDLDTLRAQITTMEKATSREISEGHLHIVSALQGMTKDIMKGFSQHAAEDREFQERICRVLEGIEKQIPRAQKAA